MNQHTEPKEKKRKQLSLMAVVEMFDTEEKAEKWFIENRWPDGVKCPHCGSDNIATVKKSQTPTISLSDLSKALFGQDRNTDAKLQESHCRSGLSDSSSLVPT